MEKEEILARSRAENRNQDIYELEVLNKANSFGNGGTIILGAVLLVACALIEGEMEYALCLMIFTPTMFTFLV